MTLEAEGKIGKWLIRKRKLGGQLLELRVSTSLWPVISHTSAPDALRTMVELLRAQVVGGDTVAVHDTAGQRPFGWMVASLTGLSKN
jgi:hypothetical protein